MLGAELLALHRINSVSRRNHTMPDVITAAWAMPLMDTLALFRW